MINLNTQTLANSKDVQSFILDYNSDIYGENFITFPDGTTMEKYRARSYLAGFLMGLRHEFRIGPNANYKAHINQDFKEVCEIFQVARPKDAFVSIGKLYNLCDISSIIHLANPGKKGKTLCIWRKKENQHQCVKDFYNEWILNIKSTLEKNDGWSKEDFEDGYYSKKPRSISTNSIVISQFTAETPYINYNNRDRHGGKSKGDDAENLFVQSMISNGSKLVNPSDEEDIRGIDKYFIHKDGTKESYQIKGIHDPDIRKTHFKVTADQLNNPKITTIFNSPVDKWAFYIPYYDPDNMYIFSVKDMARYIKFHFQKEIDKGWIGTSKKDAIKNGKVFYRERQDQNSFDGFVFIPISVVLQKGNFEKLPIPKDISRLPLDKE